MNSDLLNRWQSLIAPRPVSDGQRPSCTPDMHQQAEFRDEAGNCRLLDRLFIQHCMGIDPGPVPLSSPVECTLWHRVAKCRLRAQACNLDGETLPPLEESDGPLVPSRVQEGIESWHEAELASLHALSWICLTNRELRERCDRAGLWLLREVQPDNACFRPWALHWFVWMAARNVEAEQADMYAQLLLHNCHVHLGTPDRVSACMLRDSSAWIDAIGRFP